MNSISCPDASSYTFHTSLEALCMDLLVPSFRYLRLCRLGLNSEGINYERIPGQNMQRTHPLDPHIS
jgi:hypothetical protein